MIQAIREKRDREDGFTLIELMVVVLIIAILVAIAIPTFLGARERAQDKAAQSSLRNALTAAKTLYTDNSTYTGIDSSALRGVEPSLVFVDAAASTTEKDVSHVVGGTGATAGQLIYLAAKSDSGKCFYLKDDVSGANPGGTFYQSDSTSPCAAKTDGTWATSW